MNSFCPQNHQNLNTEQQQDHIAGVNSTFEHKQNIITYLQPVRRQGNGRGMGNTRLSEGLVYYCRWCTYISQPLPLQHGLHSQDWWPRFSLSPALVPLYCTLEADYLRGYDTTKLAVCQHKSGTSGHHHLRPCCIVIHICEQKYEPTAVCKMIVAFEKNSLRSARELTLRRP